MKHGNDPDRAECAWISLQKNLTTVPMILQDHVTLWKRCISTADISSGEKNYCLQKLHLCDPLVDLWSTCRLNLYMSTTRVVLLSSNTNLVLRQILQHIEFSVKLQHQWWFNSFWVVNKYIQYMWKFLFKFLGWCFPCPFASCKTFSKKYLPYICLIWHKVYCSVTQSRHLFLYKAINWLGGNMKPKYIPMIHRNPG